MLVLQHPRSGISGDFMGFSDNDSESEASDPEVGSKKKDSIASDVSVSGMLLLVWGWYCCSCYHHEPLVSDMLWIICLTHAASCHWQRPLLNYYSNILFEEQLLEGLSNWMDRLFEGTTVRYHINYWPDWPGK